MRRGDVPAGVPLPGHLGTAEGSCRPQPQTRHLAGGCASTKPGSRARGRRPAAQPARGDTTWRGGPCPRRRGRAGVLPPPACCSPSQGFCSLWCQLPGLGLGGVACGPCTLVPVEAGKVVRAQELLGSAGHARPRLAPPCSGSFGQHVSWRHGRQGLPTPSGTRHGRPASCQGSPDICTWRASGLREMGLLAPPLACTETPRPLAGRTTWVQIHLSPRGEHRSALGPL